MKALEVKREYVGFNAFKCIGAKLRHKETGMIVYAQGVRKGSATLALPNGKTFIVDANTLLTQYCSDEYYKRMQNVKRLIKKAISL